MTTQLAPHRTDLPPPHTSALSDAGSVVGWLSDETIGFGGFANEVEAMAAAWMSHRTLSRQRARRDGTRPVPVDVEPLALVRDGQREAIVASGRSIGTLIRPGDDSRSGPDAFGFELHVPAQRDPARLRAMAFLLYRTLRRSGIRWTLWRADDRRGARLHGGNAPHDSPATDAPRSARDGVPEEASAAEAGASESGSRGDATGARRVWRRAAGVAAMLAVVAVTVLLPLLTTAVAVSALGGVAALVAIVALAAIARLVLTDMWTEVRQTVRRRRGGATRGSLRPTAAASPPGRHLGAFHRAWSGP